MHDKDSTTKKNIDYIKLLTDGFSPAVYSKTRIEAKLPRLKIDGWKESLLTKMLDHRQDLWNKFQDTGPIQEWINSLCST